MTKRFSLHDLSKLLPKDLPPEFYCPKCDRIPSEHDELECEFEFDPETTKWYPEKGK